MRQPRSQIALAAVLLLLGLLVVVQLRAQQAGTGLETQSSQDLTLLIANLTTRNDQLRGDTADLERQLDGILAARAGGETALGQLRDDLVRVRLWSGIDSASGAGIRVLLRGDLPAVAVSDLLNELRNAGAEAISIGGVRVVAGTVVAGPVGALSVENTALGPRIEILAIGNPAGLTGALTRVGGIAAQLGATYSAEVEVTPLDGIVVPATERILVPTLGKPRP
jgi:uncharacterized protein YlxW (UPF0749 family)